jgi:hypothetical protein
MRVCICAFPHVIIIFLGVNPAVYGAGISLKETVRSIIEPESNLDFDQ